MLYSLLDVKQTHIKSCTMIRTTDIHSITDFQRNAKSYIAQVTQTKNPIAITVNGQAEVVVQDAVAYQAMLDELEAARFAGAIGEGERAISEGRVRPASQVFVALREKRGE